MDKPSRPTQEEQKVELENTLRRGLLRAIHRSKKNKHRRGSAALSTKTVQAIRRLGHEQEARAHLGKVLEGLGLELIVFLQFKGDKKATISVRPKNLSGE